MIRGPRTSLRRRGLAAILYPRHRTFEHRLAAPAAAQGRLLGELTRLAAKTEYGRSLGVEGGESYREFTRRVPVVAYEDVCGWIERQAASTRSVLAPQPIVIFEETSGSSGPSKLIPYTPALLGSFNRMFHLWLYDLLAHGPTLRTGRTFASISPAGRIPSRTPSGVRIGFGDDTEYLSGIAHRLLRSRLVRLPDLGGVREPSALRHVLATRLLAEAELEVISIWSPTYLLSLLDWANEHREEILVDLRRGAVGAGDAGDTELSLPHRNDACELLEGSSPLDWKRIWPRLRLLSCWTDGAAGMFVPRLRRELPDVTIQGKGHLATEAPITLPLFGAPAPVPLLDEVFLEFESDDGRIRRLHELEDGESYELIVSQKGGLVRYRMNDVVEAAGRRRGTPCLTFVSRAHSVSDLAGEKLHEGFVRQAIRKLPGDDARFTFLVPVPRDTGGSYYLCVTEGAEHEAEVVGNALEKELMHALQYRQARLLGQLGPLRAVARRDARERYVSHFVARGMKWGDIKYETLIGPVPETEIESLCE